MQTPLVLEIAVTLGPDHRADLKEACGSKIVAVKYGNSMIMDIEESIFHEKIADLPEMIRRIGVFLKCGIPE